MDFDWIVGGPDEQIRKYWDQVSAMLSAPIQVLRKQDDLATETTEAAISFRTDDVFATPALRLRDNRCSRDTALHEGLHLWRYLVERIPRLVAGTTCRSEAQKFATLENELEHTVIVPLQTSLGYLGTVEFLESRERVLLARVTAEFLRTQPEWMVTLMNFRQRALRADFEQNYIDACRKAGLHHLYREKKLELEPFNVNNVDSKKQLLRKIIPAKIKRALRLHYVVDRKIVVL